MIWSIKNKGTHKDVHLDTTLAEAMDEYKIGFRCKLKHNKEYAKRERSNKRSGFHGGTYDDLFKTPNLAKFERKRKSMKWEKEILTKSGTHMSRKRRWSEHDGEWSYDRRWELMPFQRTERLASPIRVVEMDIYMSVSSRVQADTIDEFGATVWAISNIIESRGVQVGIRFVYLSNRSAGRDGSEIRIRIKNPGEYLAPERLAATCSTNFVRRVMFSAIVASADHMKKEVAFGLGQPRQNPDVKYENGVLTLGVDRLRGNTDLIKQEIKKIIGG